MRLLLDTHVLLWAVAQPNRLPAAFSTLLEDTAHQPVFSVASLWEITIKRMLARADFDIEPALLRQALLKHGYAELPILADHILGLRQLPDLHRDPFDRLLVAQATCEQCLLLTSDRQVSRYPGPIQYA